MDIGVSGSWSIFPTFVDVREKEIEIRESVCVRVCVCVCYPDKDRGRGEKNSIITFPQATNEENSLKQRSCEERAKQQIYISYKRILNIKI